MKKFMVATWCAAFVMGWQLDRNTNAIKKLSEIVTTDRCGQ